MMDDKIWMRMYKMCKTCGKRFIVTNAEDYTYKIRDTRSGNKHDYYCKYSCWTLAVREREKTVRKKRG